MNASDELANGKEAKQKVKNNLHAYESRVTRLSNMQRRENAIFLLFLRIFVLFENRRTERVKKLRVFVLIVDLRPSFVCTNKDRKSIWIYYRCWKNERKQQNYAFSADGKSKTGEKEEEWRIETGKERRASSLGASNKNSNRTFRSSERILAGCLAACAREFLLSSYSYSSAQICTYIRTRDATRLLKNGRHHLKYLCIAIPRGEEGGGTERDHPFSLVTKHASIFSAFFVARKEPDASMYRSVGARTAKEIATTIRTYLSPPFVLRATRELAFQVKHWFPRGPLSTSRPDFEFLQTSTSTFRFSRRALVPRYM